MLKFYKATQQQGERWRDYWIIDKNIFSRLRCIHVAENTLGKSPQKGTGWIPAEADLLSVPHEGRGPPGAGGSPWLHQDRACPTAQPGAGHGGTGHLLGDGDVFAFFSFRALKALQSCSSICSSWNCKLVPKAVPSHQVSSARCRGNAELLMSRKGPSQSAKERNEPMIWFQHCSASCPASSAQAGILLSYYGLKRQRFLKNFSLPEPAHSLLSLHFNEDHRAVEIFDLTTDPESLWRSGGIIHLKDRKVLTETAATETKCRWKMRSHLDIQNFIYDKPFPKGTASCVTGNKNRGTSTLNQAWHSG